MLVQQSPDSNSSTQLKHNSIKIQKVVSTNADQCYFVVDYTYFLINIFLLRTGVIVIIH